MQTCVYARMSKPAQSCRDTLHGHALDCLEARLGGEAAHDDREMVGWAGCRPQRLYLFLHKGLQRLLIQQRLQECVDGDQRSR